MLFMALILALAQESSDGVPATSNVRSSRWPAVHPDGRVSFYLKATDAKTVEVRGKGALWGGKPWPLEKDAKGFWSGTSREPAEPGFYYYELVVDGVAMNDPGSETYYGWAHDTSGLEIPDKTLDFYDIKPVPHGEVRIRTYFSKTTEASRRVF